MKTASLVAFAAILLASGSAAQSPVAKASAPARPAMWVVKDADTTIYMFGTVHLLDPKYRWFEGSVKTAFDRSGELVVEMVSPPGADTQAIITRYAVDASGKTLTSKLKPDLAKRYGAQMTALGLSPTAFDRFEPWFAAMSMSVLQLQKEGMTGEAGVEPALLAAAKTGGKTVTALEGFEEQLGFLDTLPEDEQIRFLAIGLEQIEDSSTLTTRMMDAWAKGDDKRLADAMNEGMEGAPLLAKRLLDERNAKWAAWIEARMDRPGAVFLAVGAGHLGGPASVQGMLAKRGLKVARVNK